MGSTEDDVKAALRRMLDDAEDEGIDAWGQLSRYMGRSLGWSMSADQQLKRVKTMLRSRQERSGQAHRHFPAVFINAAIRITERDYVSRLFALEGMRAEIRREERVGPKRAEPEDTSHKRIA